MLERVLQLVGEGGLQSVEDLAGRLSTSPELLTAMLQDLVRLGYLQAAGDGCGESCKACHTSGCGVVGRARLWALTERGTRAVERQRVISGG